MKQSLGVHRGCRGGGRAALGGCRVELGPWGGEWGGGGGSGGKGKALHAHGGGGSNGGGGSGDCEAPRNPLVGHNVVEHDCELTDQWSAVWVECRGLMCT